MTAEQISTPELAPIAETQRISVMDILRGFALIGIVLMNIEWFGRSVTELGTFDFSISGGDWAAGWLIRLLVEGKFYKLFSLLFGMGFAVMLIGVQRAGRPFGAWFSRRMLFLLLFGCLHLVFLWEGDILHDYALGGLLLLGWVYLLRWKKMQRFNNNASFLRLGLILLCFPLIAITGFGVIWGSTHDQEAMIKSHEQKVAVLAKYELIKQDPLLSAELIAKAEAREQAQTEPEGVDEESLAPEALLEYKTEQYFIEKYQFEQKKQAEIDALNQDSYWTTTAYRFKAALGSFKFSPIMALLMSFPLFLIGYWFIASGVISEPIKHLRLFKTMTVVGLGVGLFFSTGGLVMMTHPVLNSAIEVEVVGNIMFVFSQLPFTAGYLGLIVLVTLTQRGQRWLAWLAPMGRMALTNYITHSFVLSTLFYGYGWGLYGHVSRLEQVGVVVVIIAIQAVLCHWWLKHFQFGPLEWLWRSLTYLKLQPMKHR